jgi:HK97 family phage major capsid protein
MLDHPPDLDEYRSVEELQKLKLDVLDELRTMEREANGRPYDNEGRSKFKGLHETGKKIDNRIGELRGRERRLRELAGRPGGVEHTADAFRDPNPARHVDPFTPRHLTEAREKGMRAIEANASVLSARAADRLERHINEADPQGLDANYIAAVGDPNYRTAFGKIMMDPTTGHLRFTPAEVEAVRRASQAEAQRSLNVTTGSAGAFAIPIALDPSIIMTGSGVLNPLRDLSTVETISSTIWKGVASDGVVAAFAAEAAAATDASPTLVQPSITTQKAFAFVPFSIEVGQDWPSLETELGRLFTDSKNVLEATKFLLGTGTNEPGGILNIGGTGGLTTTQRVQTATSATYAVGDPWLLKAQVPPRFITTSSYVANPVIWDKTYRFVAQGSTTEPRQFSDGDRGGDFLGRPKAELSTVVSTTTTASKIMLGGDLKTGYRVVDRIGGTIEIINHLFGAAQGNLPTGQRGAYFYWRVGGGVVAPNALRYLEVL